MTNSAVVSAFLAGAVLSGAITGGAVYTIKNREVRQLGASLDKEHSRNIMRGVIDTPTTKTVTITPQPASGPNPGTTMPGDGIFLIGYDILPGTYRSTGNGPECYWERLSPAEEIVVNNSGPGQQLATITAATDRTFRTSGCQPWNRL